MNIPSSDNKCSLINSVTAHIPHYISATYDSYMQKLIEEPQYNVTGGNWSDLGTKCMRDAKDFEHKRGGVTISRNSPQWLEEWEERKPEQCNVEVCMDDIHGLLEKYGFEVTLELETRLKESQRKQRKHANTIVKSSLQSH